MMFCSAASFGLSAARKSFSTLDRDGDASVALCLTGEPRGTIEFTADLLLTNLLDALPFKVDVYVVSTPGRPGSVLDDVAIFSTEIADPDEDSMRSLVRNSATDYSQWQ